MATPRGTGRRATGCFETREQLTSHVWAMRRQQVFSNFKAIAGACGVTTKAVQAIVESEEGLQAYLQKGCQSGGGRSRATRGS